MIDSLFISLYGEVSLEELLGVVSLGIFLGVVLLGVDIGSSFYRLVIFVEWFVSWDGILVIISDLHYSGSFGQ